MLSYNSIQFHIEMKLLKEHKDRGIFGWYVHSHLINEMRKNEMKWNELPPTSIPNAISLCIVA